LIKGSIDSGDFNKLTLHTTYQILRLPYPDQGNRTVGQWNRKV